MLTAARHGALSRARWQFSVGSGAPLAALARRSKGCDLGVAAAQRGDTAASLVREGVSLARALREPQVFPAVLVHLVANGEIERSARDDARARRRRARARGRAAMTWFAALLQPLLIVAMGAIVLVLVLAVMLPIVSMNQLIR
jgi:general secretion pathway protein F